MTKKISSKTQPCTIYFIRHAESEGNVANIFGQDTLLTENGQEQAELLAKNLSETHIDAIYASTYIRTIQTATPLAKQKKLTICTDDRLKEKWYGKFEGLTVSHVHKNYAHIYESYHQADDAGKLVWKGIPEGESELETALRVESFLAEIQGKYTGQTLACVSHGNAIRSFMVRRGWVTLAFSPPGTIENTGFVVFEVRGSEYTLISSQGVNFDH